MTRSTGTTPQRDTAQEDPTIDPSDELVGCLLQCTSGDANEILAFVTDDDPGSEMARQVLALIRAVAVQNIPPTAVAVLAHARTTGVAAREDVHKRLAHYLIGCYHAAVPGAVYARHIAVVVVECAYRRAGVEYAERVRQAAEEASLAGLEQAVGDREALRRLWTRIRIARGDTTVTAAGAA